MVPLPRLCSSGGRMSRRTGIVAAMETEVLPLVRGWQRSSLARNGRKINVFESEKAVVAVGGIGCSAAGVAATVILEEYGCMSLISGGLAGALVTNLHPGEVFEPEKILDASIG